MQTLWSFERGVAQNCNNAHTSDSARVSLFFGRFYSTGYICLLMEASIYPGAGGGISGTLPSLD